MPDSILFPGSALGWPPPVTLRVSSRARSASIRVSPRDGVVVVIPLGFSPSRYLEILEAKRNWLTRVLARQREKYGGSWPDGDLARVRMCPPGALEFRAVGERVELDYVSGAGRVRLREMGPGRVLVIAAGADGPEAAAALRRLLAGYVLRCGKRHLPGVFAAVSAQAGLQAASCLVGSAARRWGSCTAKGAVRLTSRLLFLPPRLARHVMLHELAHLAHLNHSSAFYRHLERLDPAWREHKRELAGADAFLPGFLW